MIHLMKQSIMIIDDSLNEAIYNDNCCLIKKIYNEIDIGTYLRSMMRMKCVIF
jgi:hypothetical protein